MPMPIDASIEFDYGLFSGCPKTVCCADNMQVLIIVRALTPRRTAVSFCVYCGLMRLWGLHLPNRRHGAEVSV